MATSYGKFRDLGFSYSTARRTGSAAPARCSWTGAGWSKRATTKTRDIWTDIARPHQGGGREGRGGGSGRRGAARESRRLLGHPTSANYTCRWQCRGFHPLCLSRKKSQTTSAARKEKVPAAAARRLKCGPPGHSWPPFASTMSTVSAAGAAKCVVVTTPP
eukprot:SAG31_NODE_2252_length_6076_cov_2.828342_7_plen_161_part_00